MSEALVVGHLDNSDDEKQKKKNLFWVQSDLKFPASLIKWKKKKNQFFASALNLKVAVDEFQTFEEVVCGSISVILLIYLFSHFFFRNC